RAVPRDELTNRVVVGALPAPRGQAAENRRLCVLQIRQSEHPFRCLLARVGSSVWHGRRPPWSVAPSMPPDSVYTEVTIRKRFGSSARSKRATADGRRTHPRLTSRMFRTRRRS